MSAEESEARESVTEVPLENAEGAESEVRESVAEVPLENAQSAVGTFVLTEDSKKLVEGCF